MDFNFVEEDEQVQEEDEGFDWSEFEDEDKETIEVDGLELAFDDEIPEARSITDPEVQKKAKKSRKKKRKKQSREAKKERGVSYLCASPNHYLNLCEREQRKGIISCTHKCHTERGFSVDSVSDSDDEEFTFSFD